VQSAGYRAAFQLADRPLDVDRPLLTIRRVLTLPTWDVPTLLGRIGLRAAPHPAG
jgi:hypothetical protein